MPPRGRRLPCRTSVSASASRFWWAAAREGSIAAMATAGTLLFAFHQSFYGGAGLRVLILPPWVFFLLTAVLYLFLRTLVVTLGLFFPRQRPEFIVCPECGRLLDDTSPEGVEAHRRIAVTPRPTEREVLAAVMLRRAIDDARRASRRDLSGASMDVSVPPREVENAPVSLAEFDRILRDLDRTREGRGPPERRPRGQRDGPARRPPS